ncbi:DUF5819 family protein [Brevibacterium casei]|uniref:Uncharacterized protein n=1 Tax=Brevibacterium casei TaxID=33889 RepID=A0A269ZGC8_9MICO|nr:DUF5819 family protein [Brevibacterium casei]MCT1550128.1 DUF5819 family protein [Brevibacterium casei]MCT1559614.1 DUF5819 family protein [Brevibacterium casei]MCT2208198.1 DUF5819 family protein [Brevibacterium casei]PAK96858.1 hypothetical protein B8X04_02845 [Brevibacterium casei]QPS34222.1 hypothetical protein I6G59_02500 [Brevibacterium casei]
MDEKKTHPALKRTIMVIAMALTGFHLFATFLWIAPSSALREVIPGDLLSKYMIPMWGQSWSVFAPEPINGDYYFDVRAVVSTPDGGEETTDWVRATDVELDHSTYKLFPPRSAGLAIGVASDLKGSWEALSDDHKAIVALDYFKGDDSVDRLEAKLSEYDDPDGAVSSYLEDEEVATRYATQVALAVWGEDVQRVQYQAARQNVVPFAKRNDKDAERPAIQPVPVGWRALSFAENQSNEEFAQYFCASDTVRCVSEQ